MIGDYFLYIPRFAVFQCPGLWKVMNMMMKKTSWGRNQNQEIIFFPVRYIISNDDDEVNEEKLKRGDIFPSLVQRVEIWWVGGKCTNCTNFRGKPLASLTIGKVEKY